MGSKINDTDRIDSIDKMRAEPDTLYVHHHTHFPLKLRPIFSGSVPISLDKKSTFKTANGRLVLVRLGRTSQSLITTK